jgi:hypothetical protein
MDRVLTDELVQARKHYLCDACYHWLQSGYELNDCTTSKQRLIVEAAEADNWKILPGQKYRKVTGIWEGELTTYRARPGMQSVIEQLGLCDE